MTTRSTQPPDEAVLLAKAWSGPELDATVDATVRANDDFDGRLPARTGDLPGVVQRVDGRYALGELLGSGGFGAVYAAHDSVGDRTVAVKLLGMRTDRELQRFRYETTSLRMLQVPGVVRLLDEGIFEGEAFIVMEKVEGKEFPGVSTPTSWELVAQPTIALLEALARVHALGVVHRDLKPSNVLIDHEGHITILDFGVSTLRGVTPNEGEVVGTPTYLSPEQAAGQPVDARSDIYSVGVMLFEALSGAVPHGGSTSREVLRAKVERRAPSLHSLAPEIPQDVAQLVDWLLEQHPSDRPQTVGEVLDALLGREPDDPVARRVEALAAGQRLTAERLAPIFAGPEAFVHIPSDAAELALRRAGENAEAVANELGAWIRAGLARFENGAIAVERSALHRITAMPVRQQVRAAGREVSPEQRDLLTWIALAGPGVRASDIARAGQFDGPTFDSLVGGLLAAGVIRTSADGGYTADASAVAGIWPTPRVRAAHRALFAALRPGHPARLKHAILATDVELIVAELDAFVEASIREGRLSPARALVAEAARLMRREPDLLAQERVLTALAELAMSEATVLAYDELLVEARCMPRQSTVIERLAMLARGGLLSLEGDVGRALEHLDAAGEFPSPVLELRRRACRMQAVRFDAARYAELMEEARGWVAAAPSSAMAQVRAWGGRIHYSRGRFAEAAESYLWAAGSMESSAARMLERLNAAGALLETYVNFDEVVPLAAQLREDARQQRNPVAEARAFWIERAARYRRGEDLVPDFDAAEAVGSIGLPWQAALLISQEAAHAWRMEPVSTGPLFDRAAVLAASGGTTQLKLFCRLAAGVSRGAPGPEVLAESAEFAERPSTPPGVAAQMAYLVGMVRREERGRAHAIIAAAREKLPVETHRFRRELFSLMECNFDR
jgi:predicted Ser/Thr protein kinase/tetratricopeptide (TPR) repeat protein